MNSREIESSSIETSSKDKKKPTRRRRKRLVRIQDWNDGVRKIWTWSADFNGPHPMYEPAVAVGGEGVLHYSPDHAEKRNKKYFMTAEDLNQLRPEALKAVEISFALQSTEGGAGLTYERLIHDQGLVLTRNNSWHDVLNALTWFYLPRGKRALNRLQCVAADVWTKNQSDAAKAGRGRSPLQAKLAHFDECGGILLLPASIDVPKEIVSMHTMLKERDWMGFFHRSRQRWLNNSARMVIFGHGLLEQGLSRVPTMVAHSLVFVLDDRDDGKVLWSNDIVVSETRLEDMDLKSVLALMDDLLKTHFDDRTRLLCSSPSGEDVTFSTCPVPILGIPGWSPDNAEPTFYHNTSLFR